MTPDYFKMACDIANKHAEELREILNCYGNPIEKIQATKKEIDRARDMYQTDDIEIDDCALSSPVDNEGRWVAAWVWVSNEDMEEK